MADLTLRKGLVVTPTGIVRGGLSATRGQIIAIGADETLERGQMDIDVGGKIIFPGVIDPHVHLGVGKGKGIQAGVEKFEQDCLTESQDAAQGGVTTMITTTTFGAKLQVPLLEELREAGEGRSYVDYRLTACPFSRDHIKEIPDLVKRGVHSFKFLLGYGGPQAVGYGMPPEGITWDIFYETCEAIAAHPGAIAMIHAEDPFIRRITVRKGRASGRTDYLQAWHAANPDILEPMQIFPAGLVARETGCPLYVVHTSAAESVDTILFLKQQGVNITAETVVCFLYYTAKECDEKGLAAYAKIQPPIRGENDRARLWRGLNDGGISCVGSDCLNYWRETRHVDFWRAEVGIGPGMSCTVPVMYTAGVLTGRITLETMAKVLCENTARAFSMYPRKGVLQPGSDADIVVIDQNAEKTIRAEDLKSAAGYTVYEGAQLRGIPSLVFLRGQLVAKDYQIVASRPLGQYVP